MVSLPTWIWVFYFIFLVFTLTTALISNFKNRSISYAYTAIILSFAAPLFSFLFSVGRPEGVHSISYVFSQIWNGNLFALAIVLANIYLLFWDGLFIKNYRDQLIRYYHRVLKKIQDTDILKKREKSQ
ncbi:hypothetical protein M948_17945 [Virgibacillus sp. CM-4]|uniref:DUF2304 domain-containing protein n=1 Tax=Virgibacillus massiliensis TaxID=1462526 RepID=A0A024QFP8_9BACI|nr:hypothetical protein M948_17945 [Virgibacillus sp. CM-4]CDQ40791.1 hypothetical protein BN990_03121 [Virgibacillus massiliensis]